MIVFKLLCSKQESSLYNKSCISLYLILIENVLLLILLYENKKYIDVTILYFYVNM